MLILANSVLEYFMIAIHWPFMLSSKLEELFFIVPVSASETIAINLSLADLPSDKHDSL